MRSHISGGMPRIAARLLHPDCTVSGQGGSGQQRLSLRLLGVRTELGACMLCQQCVCTGLSASGAAATVRRLGKLRTISLHVQLYQEPGHGKYTPQRVQRDICNTANLLFITARRSDESIQSINQSIIHYAKSSTTNTEISLHIKP